MRRDRQYCSKLFGRDRKNDGLDRGEQRWKVVMVREGAAMVREAAVRVRIGLGCAHADRGAGMLMPKMERGKKLKADVPDEREQQQGGATLPEKRQRLPESSSVLSHPKLHELVQSTRLSQLDAGGGRELHGLRSNAPADFFDGLRVFESRKVAGGLAEISGAGDAPHELGVACLGKIADELDLAGLQGFAEAAGDLLL